MTDQDTCARSSQAENPDIPIHRVDCLQAARADGLHVHGDPKARGLKGGRNFDRWLDIGEGATFLGQSTSQMNPKELMAFIGYMGEALQRARDFTRITARTHQQGGYYPHDIS